MTSGWSIGDSPIVCVLAVHEEYEAAVKERALRAAKDEIVFVSVETSNNIWRKPDLLEQTLAASRK